MCICIYVDIYFFFFSIQSGFSNHNKFPVNQIWWRRTRNQKKLISWVFEFIHHDKSFQIIYIFCLFAHDYLMYFKLFIRNSWHMVRFNVI